MKLRIDSANGEWSVFVEQPLGSGEYKKLDPAEGEIAHIDVDTDAPKGMAIVSLIKKEGV